MTDTIYGLECLVRERARAVDREVRRRRMLSQAPRRASGLVRRMRWVGEKMLRTGRFTLGRAYPGEGCCGGDAGRR